MANSRGGRPGLKVRRENALARLEQQYTTFKAAHQNKPAWETHKGRKIQYHAEVPYEKELARLEKEINNLKTKLRLVA